MPQSWRAKCQKKHVNIQFSHNVSLAGLADELTAVKTAIMLISAKLPLSANPQDICVSLRNMGSVKCNEMADLIDSVIYKEN
ncbi:hypothetical protein DXO04_15725 [Salmonella enterica]|nr:hypothetical protein [Salmonella enterica]